MRIDLPVKPALLPLCRKLLAEGTPPATIIHVYRGNTLCFIPAPLHLFADLATKEGIGRSMRLVRYRGKGSQGGTYAPLSAHVGFSGVHLPAGDKGGAV